MVQERLRPPAADPPTPIDARGRWRPSPIGLTAFFVVVLITTALSWFTWSQNDANENRLLRLQTRQSGLLLQSFVQSLQTPLASAAQIAASTGGASASYRSYASAFLAKQARFVSVSLWRMRNGSGPQLIATTGHSPLLHSSGSQQDAFLERVSRSDLVGVIGLLNGPSRRLGYGYSSTQAGNGYVVYAEDILKPAYRSSTARSSPFADLRYALYLGTHPSRRSLLATSERDLRLTGRTARITIPFGTSSMTLVAAPVGVLGGRYANERWWVVAVLGGVVALAAGLAADRLVRRRRAAEGLATQNAHLLSGQRTIAESLQRAMVPQQLPPVAGLETAVRYLPGVHGIDIGGDWYDVMALGDDRFFFVVGDVSGRGLEAGSIMASLHFAIRGFVREGHDPATILTLLTRLLDVGRDKHFATVVCGIGDVAARRVTIANAGHLPPLVVGDGASEFVTTELGPPVGVSNAFAYRTVTIDVPPGSSLVLFTDGLVERRGEDIENGLRRLQACAQARHDALDDLLDVILADLTPDGTEDDTAVLALRWTEQRRFAETAVAQGTLRAPALMSRGSCEDADVVTE